MGSLMTWTSLACPFFSSSATFGKRRRDRPLLPPPPPPPPPPWSHPSPSPPVAAAPPIAVLVIRVVRLVFVFRFDQVGGVEKRTLFRPDVDERGLNPGQDRVHGAEVDVAHHAAGVGTIHQEFNKAVVLQDGHAGLARAPAAEYLPFQSMCPRSRSASSRSGSYCCPNRNAVRAA